MSGGVDSSVAAALLVQQGYDVIGMMLRLWSEPGSEHLNRCCTPDAMAQARRVSAQLGIPFYAVDARDVFRDTVVDYFINGYAQGITPNPCLVCNRSIRWSFLLDRALSLGAQFMATGHYARLFSAGDGNIQLWRAIDLHKDQSYVLHVLGQAQLAHALFPLGAYTKPQVRQLARDFALPVAERPESQDLCFLGPDDYRAFLGRMAPLLHRPGPILDPQGRLLGEHQGLAFYTIGQRKGLGVTSSVPVYVLQKDIDNNTLVVGPREALGQCELWTEKVNWVSGGPPGSEFRAQVKIRYKAAETWGLVTLLDNGGVRIRFEAAQRDITPGQAAVMYRDDICLGGGVITAGQPLRSSTTSHIR
jgi:tRNA-specific 2-thiouridylase